MDLDKSYPVNNYIESEFDNQLQLCNQFLEYLYSSKCSDGFDLNELKNPYIILVDKYPNIYTENKNKEFFEQEFTIIDKYGIPNKVCHNESENIVELDFKIDLLKWSYAYLRDTLFLYKTRLQILIYLKEYKYKSYFEKQVLNRKKTFSGIEIFFIKKYLNRLTEQFIESLGLEVSSYSFINDPIVYLKISGNYNNIFLNEFLNFFSFISFTFKI